MISVESFFDPETYTLTYVVYDSATSDAIVIDPVLNYEPWASTISFESLTKLYAFIDQKKLKVHAILETHAHADHLSGAHEFKAKRSETKVAIGNEIVQVQKTFSELYNMKGFAADGSCFDILLKDGETVSFGSLEIKIISTPGHTPACCSFLIEDCLFTGDVLFMPDSGTGRCDFPAGSAKALYHSVHEKLYKLPDSTRTFTGHDYQPNGRELKFEATIGEHKSSNIQLKESTTEQEYCEFREDRDKTLKAPKLLLPSLQANIQGGKLPEPEDNGVPYFRIPISKT